MEAAVNVMTWIVPIVVAVITGGFSYLGVYKSVKSSHDQIKYVLSECYDNSTKECEKAVSSLLCIV